MGIMSNGKRAVKNVVSAFFRPVTDRPRRKVPDQRTHPRRVQRRTQHVKVVGPDGKPVVELRLFGNLMRNPFGRGWSGSEFTFVHTDPGKDEPILVVNPDETAGTMFVAKGDEPDPISVTLQPAATVTGRLVDVKGRPRPDVPFVVMQDLKTTRVERFPGAPPTGPDGRFRIRGLVAGVSYTVREITFNATLESEIGNPVWTVKSGETQDWGDVQAKAVAIPVTRTSGSPRLLP
jgi:hypothetical protein